MRLLVIAILGCVVATNAMTAYDYTRDGKGGARGLGGGYRRGYEYGEREGGRRSFGTSGFNNQGGSVQQDYGQRRKDYKAVVEKHVVDEHDRSRLGNYNNRGGMTRSYGSGGRSQNARGFGTG